MENIKNNNEQIIGESINEQPITEAVIEQPITEVFEESNNEQVIKKPTIEIIEKPNNEELIKKSIEKTYVELTEVPKSVVEPVIKNNKFLEIFTNFGNFIKTSTKNIYRY
jgi:hypothetical protein